MAREHAVVGRLQRHVQVPRHARVREQLAAARRRRAAARPTTGARAAARRAPRSPRPGRAAAPSPSRQAPRSMPLSTTSPPPASSPARAAASACASGKLRGRPRTSRTTQYVQAPAQPSWTLSTRRVRAPGVARGAATSGGRGRQRRRCARRGSWWRRMPSVRLAAPEGTQRPRRAGPAHPCGHGRPVGRAATVTPSPVELLRVQRGGAAGHHHAPAGRGRAPNEPARLALGLGRHAAGVHDDDVGRIPLRHGLEPGGGEARQGLLAVGLAHLAAHEARGDPGHARLVRCSVSQVPSSARAASVKAGNAASASSACSTSRPASRRCAGGASPAAAPSPRQPALRQPQDRAERDVGHDDVGRRQRVRGVGRVAHEKRRARGRSWPRCRRPRAPRPGRCRCR